MSNYGVFCMTTVMMIGDMSNEQLWGFLYDNYHDDWRHEQ